jgi:hypothetical protein
VDSRFHRSLLSFINWEVARLPPPGFDVNPDEMAEARRYLMESDFRMHRVL